MSAPATNSEFAEHAAVVRAATVVGCHPYCEAQCLAEIAQPALHLCMGGIVGSSRLKLFGEGGRFLARLGQIALPLSDRGSIAFSRRRRIALHSDIEQQSGNCAQIVGQEVAVATIQGQHTLAHGQVVVPFPELDARTRQRVVSVDDRGVEGNRQRRVNEVQQVGDGRAQPLDAVLVQLLNRLNQFLFGVAAIARMQQPGERSLMIGILIDVRDAQFGLPEEGMVRPLEDLALLCNRGDHGFEGGPAIGVAECPSLNLIDDRADAAPNGAEVLEALRPEKPRLICPVPVSFPSLNERSCQIGHARQCSSKDRSLSSQRMRSICRSYARLVSITSVLVPGMLYGRKLISADTLERAPQASGDTSVAH